MGAEGGAVVTAVVAARNRADTVGATVTALGALAHVESVWVVDDGSTDDTAAVAAAAGARVVRLPGNRGKGGAVAAGVASTPETEVYLLIDADVGLSARAAGPLLQPVLAGEADMTVGMLPGAAGRGGFGLVRDLSAIGIYRACGFRALAPLSGQRAVAAPLLRSLDLAPRFGLETALTIDAVRAGARVVEIEVALDHRHTGRTLAGFAHRAGQGRDVVAALWPRLGAGRRSPTLTALAAIVGTLCAALRSTAVSVVGSLRARPRP